MLYGDNPCISPTNSLSFVGEDCLTPNNLKVPARVFKKNNYIYKLYDTVVDPVNLDLLQLSLHDAKVENLSVDKRLHCILLPSTCGCPVMNIGMCMK